MKYTMHSETIKNKTFELNTKDDLLKLIENGTEESTVIEYKRSFAMKNPKWKEELAKDVSAMANSNGGVIIFGIKEKDCGNGHSIPEALSPIPTSEMSKDRLSQFLSSNIQPIIENLEITFIPNTDEDGFFVVHIPQSSTAHQNRLTHIYYKRRNATVEAMEDYEIRDVMNRNKTPIIDLEFQIIKTIVNVTEKKYTMMAYRGIEEEKSQKVKFQLKFRPINNGQMFAKYINYFVYIPNRIVVNEGYDMDDEYSVIFGDNTTRDLMDISGFKRQYGPVRYDPILPGVYGKNQSVELSFKNVQSFEDLPIIKYEIHADNAPIRIKHVNWDEIEMIERTKNETIDPMASPRFPM